MKNCRLCFDSLQRGPIDAWNEPLYESSNFVVLASLGALIEGWLLLVPKKHVICMGALPGALGAEMQEMKQILCSLLQNYYGQVCAFEHGPSRANCSVGCSVDHAHLHLAPVTFDLASAASPFLPQGVRWVEAGLDECRQAFARGEDYLFLEQPIGAGRISVHRAFGSQIFRRAIAAQVGAPSQFNWRDFPRLQNVSATIEKLRTWDGNVSTCMSRAKVAA